MKKIIQITFLSLLGASILIFNTPKLYASIQGTGKYKPLTYYQSEEPLLENVVYRYFSNTSTKDKFTISISGTSITEGTMKFIISTFDGLTIHLEEHPSTYLIGYGLVSSTPPTPKEEEEYIRKRVNDFFNDDNFSSPAIEENEHFEIDYSNEEDWNDIISDQTAVGFYYLIGEESGCQIAYSKKRRKIVTYYCCC
ncbi:MAG: hypothetical protein RLO12_10340 [Fulvivirga sp.]